MANTLKLNWLLRKLLSLPYSSRKSRQMDESRRMGTHSGTSGSNGSGKRPQRPSEKSLPTSCRSVRFSRSRCANSVRKHLDSSKKDDPSLPLIYNKQRRDKQLAKSLGSQEGSVYPKDISTIPLKELGMCKPEQAVASQKNHRTAWRVANDSSNNAERMVRKMQSRLLKQRVESLFEDLDKKEPAAHNPKKCQELAKSAKQDKAMEELLKTVIGLESMASKEKEGAKDVKISRMQTKLEWDGQRSARRSMEPFRDNLQACHAYYMRIVCSKKPEEEPSCATRNSQAKRRLQDEGRRSSLVKEEQKRLDILKAEWVQLKGLENNARSKNNCPKGPKKPTDTDANMAPTDLDLKSLIVDPKSFLTKVHCKSKILSVHMDDHFPRDSLVENPDVFHNVSKNIKFGEETETKSSERNPKEPKL